MSDFQGRTKCDKCKATYLNGVPHTCDAQETIVDAHQRLERFLGVWSLEPK